MGLLDSVKEKEKKKNESFALDSLSYVIEGYEKGTVALSLQFLFALVINPFGINLWCTLYLLHLIGLGHNG